MKVWGVAVLTGLLVSVGLFWLMQTMVMNNAVGVKKTAHLTMMDFVRLQPKPPERPKPPEKKVEKVQKVEKPKVEKVVNKPEPKKPTVKAPAPVPKKTVQTHEVPKLPKLDIPPLATNAPQVPVIAQPIAAPVKAHSSEPSPKAANTAKPAGNERPKSSGGANSGVVELECKPPKYPPRAMSRHIEGYVTVKFTVSPSGSVVDPVVTSAQPEDMFEEAALKAIRQCKYKQKIIDGKSVEQHATKTMKFKLTR